MATVFVAIHLGLFTISDMLHLFSTQLPTATGLSLIMHAPDLFFVHCSITHGINYPLLLFPCSITWVWLLVLLPFWLLVWLLVLLPFWFLTIFAILVTGLVTGLVTSLPCSIGLFLPLICCYILLSLLFIHCRCIFPLTLLPVVCPLACICNRYDTHAVSKGNTRAGVANEDISILRLLGHVMSFLVWAC